MSYPTILPQNILPDSSNPLSVPVSKQSVIIQGPNMAQMSARLDVTFQLRQELMYNVYFGLIVGNIFQLPLVKWLSFHHVRSYRVRYSLILLLWPCPVIFQRALWPRTADRGDIHTGSHLFHPWGTCQANLYVQQNPTIQQKAYRLVGWSTTTDIW